MNSAVDKKPVVELRPVGELQNFVELFRSQGTALSLLMFRQSGVQEWVLCNQFPALGLVKGTAQYLVDIVDCRGRDVLPPGPAGIHRWFGLGEQKVVVVVHRLDPDRPQLLVPQVGVDVVFQQSHVTVIGGGHPLFLPILLQELMQELADGDVVLVDVSVVGLLHFQLHLAGLCGRVTQAGLPDLVTVFPLTFVMDNGIRLASFDN